MIRWKIVFLLVFGIGFGTIFAFIGEYFYNPQHLFIIPFIGFIAGLMMVNAILTMWGFF